MTPTILDFAAIAHHWIDAWNSHDLNRIMTHYADDVELVSPIAIKLTSRSDGTVRGKVMLSGYLARGLEAYRVLRFDFARLYPGVRSCVVGYRGINDSMSAELLEFDAKGEINRVPAHYALPERNAEA